MRRIAGSILLLFLLAHFLPGVTLALEPEVFESVVVASEMAVRARAPEGRSLRPEAVDRRPRPKPVVGRAPEQEGVVVAAPRAAIRHRRTFLPRRPASSDRAPLSPAEDH